MAFFVKKMAKGGGTGKDGKNRDWEGQRKAAGIGYGFASCLHREAPLGLGIL